MNQRLKDKEELKHKDQIIQRLMNEELKDKEGLKDQVIQNLKGEILKNQKQLKGTYQGYVNNCIPSAMVCYSGSERLICEMRICPQCGQSKCDCNYHRGKGVVTCKQCKKARTEETNIACARAHRT